MKEPLSANDGPNTQEQQMKKMQFSGDDPSVRELPTKESLSADDNPHAARA